MFKFEEQENNKTEYLRISSKVLRLASPVFVGMFSSYIQEKPDLLQCESPVRDLKDDDFQVTGITLDIHHGRSYIQRCDTSAVRLAQLAIHCSKYERIRALSPWVSPWCKDMEEMIHGSADIGFILLAAQMFGQSKLFAQMSKEALTEMPTKFHLDWKDQDLVRSLPAGITGK